MVQGRLKSRSFKRIDRRVPSGKSKRFFALRKPDKAKCARCRTTLKGVPNERPRIMQNLAKTEKRPQRPFGGVLCSACMRAEIISRFKDQ